MLVHARSGDGAFVACLRLFRNYPLAVRRHYAEHRYGSMVLMNRAAGKVRFFVLIMEWDDLFVLRHWDRRDGARVEIARHNSVPGEVRDVIETSVPVPRDGALLGWVSGVQVQAVLAAYGRLPEPWDDASAVPGVLVMPLVGSQPTEWPPLAPSPFDDGRLWRYSSGASWRTSARWSRAGQATCSGSRVAAGPPGGGQAPASSSPSG